MPAIEKTNKAVNVFDSTIWSMKRLRSMPNTIDAKSKADNLFNGLFFCCSDIALSPNA
jgi:hypothetical protein